MKKIGIGLIGAGNIAQFHMQGYADVRGAYGDVAPEFVIVADINLEAAESIANRYGFKKVSTDWKEVIADEAVEAVLITSPNYLHTEMALAAIAAGKHIMCEKPMTLTKEEGKAICDAADAAGVITQVDFIYRQCPVNIVAKQLIDEGKLGEISTFKGWFNCAYNADPNVPMAWRQYGELAGSGALGDMTSHTISLSDMLVTSQMGEIEAVSAKMEVVHKQRATAEDPTKFVEVDTDDQHYIIIKYKSGHIGMMSGSRVVAGQNVRFGYEIYGSKGTISFELRKMNELEVFIDDGDEVNRGAKTYIGNTSHGEYKNHSIYNDYGISYSQVMGIQAHNFLNAIATNTKLDSDVHLGYYIDRIMEAVMLSSKEDRWVKMEEIL